MELSAVLSVLATGGFLVTSAFSRLHFGISDGLPGVANLALTPPMRDRRGPPEDPGKEPTHLRTMLERRTDPIASLALASWN